MSTETKQKTAEVICWVSTPRDSRFTASTTARAEIPQSDCLSVAQSIADDGDAGKYVDRFKLKDGQSLASGHPVTIRYQSGRTRVIRSEW